MYAIFLDGESKTGKTTVGSAIYEDLRKDYTVYVGVAGSFYRRLTVLALESHGGEYAADDTSWLEAGIQAAIAGREAYNEDRDWSTINSKAIDELVSVAGQFEITQNAGKEWWRVTANLALAAGADVLLLDGRNPRTKLAPWRSEQELPIALDLTVYCEPRVAAERYVRAQGVADPSEEQIHQAQQAIEKRRELDRNRPMAPYIEPANQIVFDSGISDPTEVVRQSFETDVEEPPQVIRFDTTHSSLAVNQEAAGQLARAALAYLEK